MRASLRSQTVEALETSRLTVDEGNCLTVSRVHSINTLPRCIRTSRPLRHCILATPETVNSGIAFFASHRCIRAGIPLRQCILATPETVNSATAFFITYRCIRIGTPLRQCILETPETVNSGTAFFITHRCIRIGTPLRQCILEIPETLRLHTGNCLTVARVHCINTPPRNIRVSTPLRQYIPAIPETVNSRAAFLSSHWVDVAGYTGKAAKQCSGGVGVGSFIDSPAINTGRCSSRVTQGSTPMRQLTVETVSGETAENRVTWLLLVAMLARRRQDKAMIGNGSRRVTALSHVIVEGGTPMRQLILEIVNGETAGNYAMSPGSRTRALTLPKPSVSIATNAHPGPRVSRICCLTDSPDGDTG